MSHDGTGQHSRAWPHNRKLLLLVLLLLGVPKVLGRTVIIGTRGREKRIIADLGEKPAPVLEGREGNGERVLFKSHFHCNVSSGKFTERDNGMLTKSSRVIPSYANTPPRKQEEVMH
jgi:hypothetical protein